MSASVWFLTASVSGGACAVLAIIVIIAGWRRSIPEVATLGAALLAVSALATTFGLSGTTVGGGQPGSMWAAVVALPAGIAVASPLLFPGSGPSRRAATRWRLWVTASAVVVIGASALLVDLQAGSPPPSIKLLAVGLGSAGALLLARRQLFLHRVSRRSAALVVAVAILAVAASSVGAMATTPGTSASWVLLALENSAVFTAGFAVLIGYRHGIGVAEVLGPILSREPLAALELGLSPEVHAFVDALARKDAITRDHVVRTSALAMRTAIRAGMTPAEVRAVALGGLLHDIGKLVIPSEIINKPGALSDTEFATIKTHPEQGERLLAHTPTLAGAAPHVRGHHERVDGRGYPDGLDGREISLEVALVSVADAWDAMTNTRQYREGMDVGRAESILREGTGTQWSGEAVELLLAEVRANGSVDLSNLDRASNAASAKIPAADELCPCEDALPSELHVHRPQGAMGVAAASALSDFFGTSPIVTDQLSRGPQLDEVALVDALTGIANREGFCLTADEALRVVERASGSPQVIFIAVDDSDAPNDPHDHRASDDALHATAHLLRILSRAGDVIGRLGAGEFAMFIRHGPPGTAAAVASRLRAAAEQLPPEAVPGGLALSAAAAVMGPDEVIGIEALLDRAHQAMYREGAMAGGTGLPD
jgi:diguanylate cyclase (GGDEF)-like protein